ETESLPQGLQARHCKLPRARAQEQALNGDEGGEERLPEDARGAPESLPPVGEVVPATQSRRQGGLLAAEHDHDDPYSGELADDDLAHDGISHDDVDD